MDENRVIKFRGFNYDRGWCYGHYLVMYDEMVGGETSHIRFKDESGKWNVIAVAPESVGQYTGLNDKHEKEIYSGDIFKWGDHKGEVKFKDGCFVFELTGQSYSMTMRDHKSSEFEIIGNIYEHKNIKHG